MGDVGTFTWIADPHGALVVDLPAWREHTGQSEDELLGSGWVEAIHPDDQVRVDRTWREAVAKRGLYTTEYRLCGADGTTQRLSIHGIPVLGDDGELLRYVGMGQDVTEHALDRKLLRAVIDEAPIGIALTWGPDDVFRFVNGPYRELLPDDREMIGRPAAEAIPEVDVRPLFDEVRGTGEVLRFEDYAVPWEGREGTPTVDGHRFYEYSLVPIPEEGESGEVGGVLIVAVETTEDVRRRRTLERRLDEERAVVEVLQRALLPAVPALRGLEVDVRYLPGGPDVQIGGDWYDAFEVAPGRTAVVMGDVAGRGVRAARLMSELRSAVRAYGLDGHGPEGVMARVERFFDGQELAEMATLFYGELSEDHLSLDWVSAGHPPPVLTTPAGAASLVMGGLVPPVGAGAGLGRPSRPGALRLERGSTLLLYTDGLVEDRSRSLDGGFEDLLAVCRSCASAGPAALNDAALREMLDPDARHDDVALLALRVG